MAVGCSYNYRQSATPKTFTSVPIVITVTGAAYVNPGAPNPLAEDARAYTAFVLQTGYSACPQGPKPTGFFYILNLHPYARLAAAITLNNQVNTGRDLPPLSILRVACSNGLDSPKAVLKASLVYPNGQPSKAK